MIFAKCYDLVTMHVMVSVICLVMSCIDSVLYMLLFRLLMNFSSIVIREVHIHYLVFDYIWVNQ